MRIKKKKKYETLLAYTYTEILCCSCCCLFFLIPFVPVYVLCFFVCGVCLCVGIAPEVLSPSHAHELYNVGARHTIDRYIQSIRPKRSFGRKRTKHVCSSVCRIVCVRRSRDRIMRCVAWMHSVWCARARAEQVQRNGRQPARSGYKRSCLLPLRFIPTTNLLRKTYNSNRRQRTRKTKRSKVEEKNRNKNTKNEHDFDVEHIEKRREVRSKEKRKAFRTTRVGAREESESSTVQEQQQQQFRLTRFHNRVPLSALCFARVFASSIL